MKVKGEELLTKDGWSVFSNYKLEAEKGRRRKNLSDWMTTIFN